MSLPWVEKYRPTTSEQIVSHDKIKRQINEFLRQNALPNLLFNGPAGVGKTTLIKAIARQLFGDKYQDQIIEINASDENGIEVVREKINAFVKCKQLFQTEQKTKLIILDECDQMSNVAQGALRRIIELSPSARFCLICNYVSKIIPPLQSRCAVFRFRPIDSESCTQMLLKVCVSEGIQSDRGALKAIYDICQGDMRQSINLLEAVCIGNKRISEQLVYEQAHRPSALVAERFMQSQLFRERYEYCLEILRGGVSLEDLITVLFQQIMKEQNFDEKGRKIQRLAEIEENLMIGADLRTQIAGLVGVFSE